MSFTPIMDRATSGQLRELNELRRTTQAEYVKVSTSLLTADPESDEFKTLSKAQQRLQSSATFLSKQIAELEAPFARPETPSSRSVTPSGKDTETSLKFKIPDEIPEFKAGCNNEVFLKRFENILEKFLVPRQVWPAALLRTTKKGSVTFNRIDKAIHSRMSWEEAKSTFIKTFEADAKNALGGLLDDVLHIRAQRKNESVPEFAERFELACNETGLLLDKDEDNDGGLYEYKQRLTKYHQLMKRMLINLCSDFVRDKVMELPEQGLNLPFTEFKSQLIAFDLLSRGKGKRTRSASESEESRPPSRSRTATPGLCFFCNEPGHQRAECPARRAAGGRDSGWGERQR